MSDELGRQVWRKAARIARKLVREAWERTELDPLWKKEKGNIRCALRRLVAGEDTYARDAACVLLILARWGCNAKDLYVSSAKTTESFYVSLRMNGAFAGFRFSGHLREPITRQLAVVDRSAWKRSAPRMWTWAELERRGLGREGSHRGRWSTPGRFSSEFEKWSVRQVKQLESQLAC